MDVGIAVKNIETLNKLRNKFKLVQIFVTSHKDVHIADTSKIKLYVHSSYKINIARTWHPHDWWVHQMIFEIKMCYKMGGKGVVVHMGKKKDLDTSTAYNNMYTFLIHVHKKTIKYKKVKIIMETSSGQGTELCHKLEDLAYFSSKLINHKNKYVRDRFGICVDTCHIFAAGYDISKSRYINSYFDKFQKLIGLEHLLLVHMNDSKGNSGSKVDRHENIGKGKIGKKSLIKFAKIINKIGNVPIILETPHGGIMKDYKLITSTVTKRDK